MRSSAMAVMAVTGLGLALTGCGDGTGTDAGGPSASPTTTSSATPGGGDPVASCVAGNWRSTSASGQAKQAMASASINGGGGVTVNISPTGDVNIDFSTMQPLTFTARVADAKVSGTFTYAGVASGKVRTGGGGSTGAPTATPTAGTDTTGTSGTWEPVPPINWGDTRLTLDLTEPVKAQPFKDVKIGDYVGDGAKQSGDVVDIEPLLGEGLYQCQGNTLVLTPKNERGITWTLTRG